MADSELVEDAGVVKNVMRNNLLVRLCVLSQKCRIEDRIRKMFLSEVLRATG